MSPVIEIESLAPMDITGRLGRLRAVMSAAGHEALLVTSLENLRYLTGFTGSAGMLLVREDTGVLYTDGRYRDQAAEQMAAAGVEAALVVDRPAGQLEALVKAASSLGQLALEAAHLNWARARFLAERFAGVELLASTGLVEQLRVVKDEGEVARLEAACQIADVALAQTKELLRGRCTEAAFAAELDHEMRRRGASAPSFETIVASGPNSALPHARPSERTISPGELIVIDFGATVDGYHSDMTRTVCVGEPSDELGALIEAVLTAQRAGVRAVAAGERGVEVDRVCRESLSEAGYGEAFSHSTGHGVGLQVHEAPAVSQESTDILPAGSVVTVEPGAYLHERGGARIEDTVVVTDRGARILTKSTKDYTL